MLLLICSNGAWLCANLACASSSSLLVWVFWPFQCLDIAKILSTLHLCWNTASFKWNTYVYCSSLAFWIINWYTFIPTHVKNIRKHFLFSFFLKPKKLKFSSRTAYIGFLIFSRVKQKQNKRKEGLSCTVSHILCDDRIGCHGIRIDTAC